MTPPVDASDVDTMKARELHDQLLVAKPEGARHDADICSFCVEAAASTQAAPVPPGPESVHTAPEDTEGGTTTAMSDNDTKTISVETHEALLEKALREATSATEKALESKIKENAELAAEVTSLKETTAKLEADNARLNTELDTAQVDLKAATDEVASLKQAEEARLAEEAKAEIASKRAEQVRNLGLFEETFITEKASKWADLDQAAWDERVEEWGARKGAAAAADTASAMTGTSGELTKEHTDEASDNTKSTRRAALGL